MRTDLEPPTCEHSEWWNYIPNKIRYREFLPWKKSKFIAKKPLAEKTIIWVFF